MLITIFTITIVVTYTCLYSIILFAFGNETCRLSDNQWTYSIQAVIERNLQYVMWVYPVLYLFWPAEAHCHCRKKRE